MPNFRILTRFPSLSAAFFCAFLTGCAGAPGQPDESSAEVCAVDEGPAEEETAKADALTDAPDPSDLVGIVSTEVEFESMGDKLTGVIQYPEDLSGTAPAVLIAHDAGPHDRHGHFQSTLGLKLPVEVPVYQEFAENLVRHGFVVLRFDKRTCVQGGRSSCTYPRDYVEAHRADLVTALQADLKAAAAHLKADPRVDIGRVFLLGHGQGADLALSTAEAIDAAGLVLLSPSPFPIDELILHQTRFSLAHLKDKRAEAGDTTDATLLDQQIKALEATENMQVAGFKALRAKSYKEADLLGAPIATWQGLLGLHQQARAAAEKLDQPILALFGLSDSTLPPRSSSTYRERIHAENTPADSTSHGARHRVLELADTTQFMVKIDGAEQSTDVSDEAQREVVDFLRAVAFP